MRFVFHFSVKWGVEGQEEWKEEKEEEEDDEEEEEEGEVGGGKYITFRI